MSRIALTLAACALVLHLGVLVVSVETIGTRSPRPVARAADVPATVAEGLDVVRRAGCASCHDLPGPAGMGADVGPPLHDLARRRYLAGTLPHTPENLVRWIRDPQEVEPGTAMPDMGLSTEEARAVAAYLYHYGEE